MRPDETSIPTTSWPCSARHAEVTRPTYPRPTTETRTLGSPFEGCPWRDCTRGRRRHGPAQPPLVSGNRVSRFRNPREKGTNESSESCDCPGVRTVRYSPVNRYLSIDGVG